MPKRRPNHKPTDVPAKEPLFSGGAAERHLEELRISRSVSRATWLAALAAIISLPISILSLTYTIWSNYTQNTEKLSVVAFLPSKDFQLPIREESVSDGHEGSLVTGVASFVWEVTVLNNSDRPTAITNVFVSMTEYDKAHLPKWMDRHYYGFDDQLNWHNEPEWIGLFTGSELDSPRFELLEVIPPMGTARFYLRYPVVLGPQFYQRLKERDQSGIVSHSFLRKVMDETDINVFDEYIGPTEGKTLIDSGKLTFLDFTLRVTTTRRSAAITKFNLGGG